MKQFVFILLIGFTISKPAVGYSSIQWFSGSVVLSPSREVLTGRMALEESFDLILFKQSDQILVLNAHCLESFFFFDSLLNINRKFVSVPIQVNHTIINHLFEIVASGEVKVLRRVKDYCHKVKAEAVDYNYYVKRNDQLVPLQFFKERIYPKLLLTAPEDVLLYEKRNHLNLKIPSDAILLIMYINKIHAVQPLAITS